MGEELKIVKIYIAKKTVKPLFKKGDIFVECFDRPNTICPESTDGLGGSLDLAIMDSHGGWYKYFYINGTRNAKGTRYYQKVLEHLSLERDTLKEEVFAMRYYLQQKETRLKNINEFLMIDENQSNEI